MKIVKVTDCSLEESAIIHKLLQQGIEPLLVQAVGGRMVRMFLIDCDEVWHGTRSLADGRRVEATVKIAEEI
jgi:hypothetical protein